MPNLLNKNKNKVKDKDEIRAVHGQLILAQQAERRRRFQKIADGNRSAEELLETRQRVELVEEARQELLNLCSPREENSDGRALTRTARSAEGARAWSDLFVGDRLPWETTLEDPSSSPRFAAVTIDGVKGQIAEVAEQTAGVGVQTAGVGLQTVGVGVQTSRVGLPTAGVGEQTADVGVNNTSVAGTNNARAQTPGVMAGRKEKLPKFEGDGTADPIRHCKTCETIWRANGITDANEWVRQFPATLRGVAIDWFSDMDPQKLNSWDNIKKEFLAEFKLLRDDNEIVAEIFNTKQGKHETVRVYARRLKDLINKMESKPADGLQKRWFVDGLRSKLRRKMKIVPPSSYADACNKALDLESEHKTKKKKTSSSDSDDDEPAGDDSSDDEGSNKKVRALQKDMVRMMEFKNMQKEPKGSELWCIECKIDGHTKGSCPKNQFCDICQIMGHSTKDCPFNMKTRGSPQVFLTQEAFPLGSSGNTNTAGATSGGYRNNNSTNNNNNNGSRSRTQYDANGRPIVQCRACNLWGHFARDCTAANTPKLLCRWCGPGDHEDSKCPKSGVNLITVGTDVEEVLAITRRQAEEKRKLGEAQAEIAKASSAETSQLKDITGTLARNFAEQNIVRQILQTEVPVKISDLLLTMPQL